MDTLTIHGDFLDEDNDESKAAPAETQAVFVPVANAAGAAHHGFGDPPTQAQQMLAERAQLANVVCALDLALTELAKLNARAHLGDMLAYNRQSTWQRELSKVRTAVNNEVAGMAVLVKVTPTGEKYGKIDI